MAFGQQSGPPATARQLQELLDLVNAAGHSDFRDARGPLGLSQRQAGGKFTRDEADAFIARLEQENESAGADGTDDGDDGNDDSNATHGNDGGAAAPSTPPTAARASTARPKAAVSAREQQLRSVSTDALAAELQRRGWVVMEP